MSPRSRRWSHLAAGWSVTFTGLHIYWGLDGSVGLAESAGTALTEQRPGCFVVLGLQGIALALATTAVPGLFLTRRPLPGGWDRLLPLLGAGVGAVLVFRAVGVHLVLLSDAGYGGEAVAHAQRFWTLVLWNPWFLIGGLAFALAAVAARRDGRPRSESAPSA